MAYDPSVGKIVLFGGYNGVYLNDTWIFDGTTWTQVNTVNAPSPRVSAMFAYDVESKKLVLFGGFDGQNFLGDTWIWDGATSTWTQANPTNSPQGVEGAMLFTDPKNGHVDLFGGFSGNDFYQQSTWQWVGNNWKELHPANHPGARAWAVDGLDLKRKVVVISDGSGNFNIMNTWTWDGTNWAEQSPKTVLPQIAHSASAYDPDFGVVIVFGGSIGNVLNTTWAWSGDNWFLGQPEQSPPARELPGEAYDFASQQMVVFGGHDPSQFFGDTWQLVRN